MSRILKRLFLLSSSLFVTICIAIYLSAPVAELRIQKEYKPLQVGNTRVVGLGKENPLNLEEVSDATIAAIVGAEDAKFFTHFGVDIGSISMSLYSYLRGRPLAGASTITQQLAKNIYFTSERSLLRKVYEALYALKMERTFTKEEILSLYLDIVQFGPELYGIRSAAEYYFQKSPADLTISEASFLAILLPAPERYGPILKRGRLTHRLQDTAHYNQLVSHLARNSLETDKREELFAQPFLEYVKTRRKRSSANLILLGEIERDTHRLLLDLRERYQRSLPVTSDSIPYTIRQAQSYLGSYQGKPMISANFSGRYRPYIFEAEQLTPFIKGRLEELADVDLYKPRELASGQILLAGSHKGKRDFDLYLLSADRTEIRNLTQTEGSDEGDACLSPDKKLFVFRSGNDLELRTSDAPHKKYVVLPGGSFFRCHWLTQSRFVMLRTPWSKPQLRICDYKDKTVSCHVRSVLGSFQHVLAFVADDSLGLGIVGRLRGKDWYRIYRFQNDYKVISPFPDQNFEDDADILDYQGGSYRYGKRSRYGLSQLSVGDETIYRHRYFGDTLYALVSDPGHPKTLARRAGEQWSFLYPSDYQLPKKTPPVQEHWIRSQTTEESYQLFYYGSENAEHVVIWLHGGPHENVSPVYKGYFHALVEAGYGVVALNYPGSTGRGKEYEERFEKEALLDSAQSTIDWLRKDKARKISVWSISSGQTVAQYMIQAKMPVTGYIDQVGRDHPRAIRFALRNDAKIFIVRGRYDRLKTEYGVDYLYDGGHDLTEKKQHQSLMKEVLQFLENVA